MRHRNTLALLALPLLAACQVGPETSGSKAPAEWPLAVGDMVDGVTMHTLTDRFAAEAPENGGPVFDWLPVEAENGDKGRRYACLTERVDEDSGISSTFVREVAGRPYMALDLPPGMACDPDALYVVRWVYRGHQ